MSRPGLSSTLQTHTQIKGLAILAVIFIHGLTLFPDTIYTSSPYQLIFLTLNQAARFCVPVFLVVSGYGLSHKYRQQLPPFFASLRRTLSKLLPLYLIWSLIYLAILQSGISILEPKFWQYLIQGGADYHLYYVPIILQLYLIFFILHTHLNRRRLFIALVFTLIFQVIWLYILRSSALGTNPTLPVSVSDQFQYRLVLNWLFYFLFGMFLSHLDLDSFRANIKLILFFILGLVLSLCWAVIDSRQLISLTNDITYSTSFIRLPVFVYATLSALVIILYSPRLFAQKNFNSFLNFIGHHSYTIYLTHTLGLRLLDSLVTGQSVASFIAITASVLSHAANTILSIA